MTRENHILAVGSIALDTIETSKGSRSNILGGSATYFGIAAALFAPVGLIGIVGDDFPESAIDLLKSKNIDLSNVQFKPGETFQWGGRYSSDYSSRETLFTKLGVFESFAPVVQCPENQSTYLFLGNIQPELQASVNDMLSDSKVVICDTMNLWIDNNPEELKQVLKKVDIFLLNDEEALQLTNQTDLQSAADSLRKIGPQIIVIKMGVKGALLVDATGSATIPVYPHVTVLDPTGAGHPAHCWLLVGVESWLFAAWMFPPAVSLNHPAVMKESEEELLAREFQFACRSSRTALFVGQLPVQKILYPSCLDAHQHSSASKNAVLRR